MLQDNQGPGTLDRVVDPLSAMHGNGIWAPLIRFFAVVAQAFEVDDGDAAIFEPKEPLLLQPLQALVGILPGDAGERPDLFLRDLEMAREVGIENGIEQ